MTGYVAGEYQKYQHWTSY